MPGFNGMGPRGFGPRTGWGRGFCAPWGPGRTYGPGAIPYGYPYGSTAYPGTMPYGAPTGAMPGIEPYAPQVSPEQELEFLTNQAQAVRGQLEQIEARMRELETKEE